MNGLEVHLWAWFLGDRSIASSFLVVEKFARSADAWRARDLLTPNRAAKNRALRNSVGRYTIALDCARTEDVNFVCVCVRVRTQVCMSVLCENT